MSKLSVQRRIEAQRHSTERKAHLKFQREAAREVEEWRGVTIKNALKKSKQEKKSKREKVVDYLESILKTCSSHGVCVTKVRSTETWNPKGARGIDALRWSLLQHWFCKYPMAKFWYNCWTQESIRNPYIETFLLLGKGASLYKLIQQGKFPIPLTKKMCHAFLSSENSGSPFQVAIKVRMQSLNAGMWMFDEVCRALNPFDRVFPYWDQAQERKLLWFCKQLTPRPPMFDVGSIQDISDYTLRHRSYYQRSLNNVLLEVSEWHSKLAKEKADMGVFSSCGIKKFTYTQNKKTVWNVTEILTSKELVREGSAMHHCVYSYKHLIKRGSCAVFSVSLNGGKELTVEIDPKNKLIRQIKGKFNAKIKTNQITVVNRWAIENNLNFMGSIL